jgi:hypothetical protein
MNNFKLDAEDVERLLQEYASMGQDISYSDALMALGHKFTRPMMRVLCKVLGEVDERAAVRGEPELAVLVVRASDRLPGEGWWQGRARYQGEAEGEGAIRYVKRIQSKAHKFWSRRA